MKVGILALQGCVKPHKKHFEALGVEVVEVRRPEDFVGLSGLVLPGGESSTMLKLIDHFGIWKELKKASERIPFWGICAGSILMAKKVSNPTQKSLAVMDIEIKRNGYGRQVDSHQMKVKNYEVAFIRAPLVSKVGKACKVLAKVEKKPVWIQQGKHVISTFHSELNPKAPSPFHKAFVSVLKSSH